MNKGPWYNTAICSKLHGSLFEDFITHSKTDRYNLLCSIVEHDKKYPDYEDDERSIGDSLINKHLTTESLEALGGALNLIYIWLKLLDENYDARRAAYSTAMKYIFKQIPTIMKKPLSQRQKVHKRVTEIRGWWHMEK